MPQLRLGLLAGPAERVARCTRTLEWDCLRVNIASQEAARAALEGPRGWLEQIHAATAADRAVAIAAVAATPGLTAATPFAAPFLFVGSSGDGLAEQLEAVGLPVVDGAAFEGPGYARLPFGGAAEARAPLQQRARPLGPAARSMRVLGVPRRTAALIGANALGAAVQGQFQFVLPWMLLSRGHSPQTAALAAGLVYAPLLLTAIPAGAASDNTDPRRLMRIATIVMLVFCALYPLAALAGHDWFVLILIAAVAVGSTRNFGEGALFRGHRGHDGGQPAPCCAPTPCARPSTRRRCSAARSSASCSIASAAPPPCSIGICVLLTAATIILGFVPQLERESEPIAVMRENVAVGIASLRLNTRLRTIGWANLSWNVFAGAAIGIMPAVLREHLGMNEIMASATFIAGAIVVVVLTLPLVRTAQRRFGAVRTFIVAITIQATAIVLFADPRAAVVGPLVYCVFLLANSAAAASLNGARAAEVEHDHQGLLNMALLTVGMIGFILGVVLAAGLLGPLGFGIVLALIAVGMASTAAGFRRPLIAG